MEVSKLGNIASNESGEGLELSKTRPRLKKVAPYWYPYRTNAKARWFDREILEVISTEFRDRSVEYYRYALQSGVTTINGKIARPGTLIRNGDTLENIVHRHEPPVTSTPVEVLHHDLQREFIVINKPGSIPVHAAGRYFKNSLVEILKNDFGIPNVYTVNRLDRLTSGLMIIALSSDRARALTSEFTSGTIQKEYVARVRGKFPEEVITCEEPLLTVDRQMGLNIVHPEGKEAKTIFKRMHYDENTNTSVVHCRPITGRSHQIRVHLQFLGHPIANDSVYGDAKIWGCRVAKGGIDITPSEERQAPRPPPVLEDSTAEGHGRHQSRDTAPAILMGLTNSVAHNEDHCERLSPQKLEWERRMKRRTEKRRNPAWRTKEESAALTANHTGTEPEPGALPRETGHDIGLGSPVPLSREAVDIITRLRNQKDEDEDWGRWRDVVFRAKGALAPDAVRLAYAEQHVPPNQGGKRKGDKRKDKNRVESCKTSASSDHATDSRFAPFRTLPSCQIADAQDISLQPRDADIPSSLLSDPAEIKSSASAEPPEHTSNTLENELPLPLEVSIATGAESSSDAHYCPECYLPLRPDPRPEKLYIFLHALRYTSASLGSFETRLPEWAAEGYVWERD